MMSHRALAPSQPVKPAGLSDTLAVLILLRQRHRNGNTTGLRDSNRAVVGTAVTYKLWWSCVIDDALCTVKESLCQVEMYLS